MDSFKMGSKIYSQIIHAKLSLFQIFTKTVLKNSCPYHYYRNLLGKIAHLFQSFGFAYLVPQKSS